ncbi:hypothetical protein BZA70DRAFT_280818 [Myxozyma melibiosi]|uniref:Secreted protein n=1 Tax=Myxozyma melibiosi TaxID=54550 RepID=A0ABR1F3T0_9ASCO
MSVGEPSSSSVRWCAFVYLLLLFNYTYTHDSLNILVHPSLYMNFIYQNLQLQNADCPRWWWWGTGRKDTHGPL